MAKTEAVDAPEHPVDLTEELPLDDENVLAAEPPSVWRRYRWPIVGVVVVLVAGAVGLTLWLTSSFDAGHGADRDDGHREVPPPGPSSRRWRARGRSSRPARPV